MRFLFHRRAFLSFALAAALFAMMLGRPVTTWAQVEVNTCGQELAGSAVLNADLDCTGFGGWAVTIHGGALTMNGHTITGGVIGIQCDGPCEIIGPGTVTASTWFGVNAFETKLRMKNVDVTNNPMYGVQVWKKCVLEGPATISGNVVGIRNAAKLTLRNMTVTGNTGEAIEATNKVGSATVDVRDSTITGNGAGINTQRRVKVVDSTITGNGTFGVAAAGKWGGISVADGCDRKSTVSLKRSIVTGNNTNPGCGTTEICADIATCGTPPRLTDGSVCDHSHVNDSGDPGDDWNVCALD